MKLIAFLSLLFASLLAIPAQAQDHPDYAAGQVWEYRNRPQDEGSLLRIQQVEQDPRGEPIYHISVIGVRIFAGKTVTEIGHLPVSRATLDASVTRLSARTDGFPDAANGIAIWRKANGGVFTGPIGEIIETVEQGSKQQAAQ